MNRKTQRTDQREESKSETLAEMKKPTKESIESRKDRKAVKVQTAALNYGFAVQNRSEVTLSFMRDIFVV
jgi:hypothetical protein